VIVEGQTVFDLADRLDLSVATSCGRVGQCHECIVEMHRGAEALSPRTEAESFLSGDYRLACQAVVEDTGADLEFSPLRRSPRILSLSNGHGETPELDPMVVRIGDDVHYGDERLEKYRGGIYGIAMDLGTTTVVMSLADLESGECVGVRAFENPQRFGGSDIMNRISYDGKFPGEMQKVLVRTISEEIEEMARTAGIDRRQIYEIAVAGNSTMRDLIFRLDVQSIGQKPYKSQIEEEYLAGNRTTTALRESARRIGLRANPYAVVYGIPLIASHVGADVLADLVAIDIMSSDATVMLVDVGTNTEVVVKHGGRIVTASCPAGPAFEGGLIRYGMPGCDGAIEAVRYRDGKFELETIGNTKPVGICGSGLIDILAELRRHDIMSPKGVFEDRKQEVMIAEDSGITFSREDASNLAQAKAANYCGQYIVLRHLGIGPEDVECLYLAGAFANYVDVRNAIDIGFLAPVPEERIVKAGNASARGALQLLLSRRKRAVAESLVREIEHVELETTPDFFEIFVDGCQCKPMPGRLS
jgi:uncharacterized 2Fe-2S/4Fe-4S cluster protein (DUF4445 family)